MAEKDDDIEIPQGFGITDEKFNEKEEIEKLQAKIRKMSAMANDSEEMTMQSADDIPDETEEAAQPESAFIEESFDTSKTHAKKYVVTADAKYVDYFEKLSLEKRSEVFNEMLGEYIVNEDKRNAKKRMKRIMIHSFIAAITIIITLPVLLFIVNKAIHYTVLNYQDSQQNFEKLYESQGIAIQQKRKR